MMTLKVLIVLWLGVWAECVLVYSSFWAPAADPKILGYRVEATFDEGAGRRAREQYRRRHGRRGEALVTDLGSGRGPGIAGTDQKAYGEVKFYYTYPGAKNQVFK